MTEPTETPQNGRQHDRLPVEVEVAVTSTSDHNFYTGFTQNISEGGLFVATHSIAPIGTELEFEFTLAGNPEPIRVVGEVRWIREDHGFTDSAAGMGIMFKKLEPGAQKRIDDFIRSRRDSIFFDDD